MLLINSYAFGGGPLSITGDYPDSVVGAVYSYTPLTFGGLAPYSYAVTTGTLPGGLSINSSTGAVTGTPTTVEDQSFEVTVTDALTATDILVDEIEITSGTGDPLFALVKALLHFNGSNGSTTITDELGHAFNTVGSGTEITTAQSVDGESLRLPGNTSYMRSTSGGETDFGLGTGEYTAEMFVRMDATGGTQFFFDMRGAGSGPILAVVSNQWWAYFNGGFRVQTGTPVANTWYHVAIARDSADDARLFVDGVQLGSTYNDTANYGTTAPIFFGGPADAPTSLQFTGYIDDFRLTTGVGSCRYTTNFTPPTPPFADA